MRFSLPLLRGEEIYLKRLDKGNKKMEMALTILIYGYFALGLVALTLTSLL